jgi:hypothetical protein
MAVKYTWEVTGIKTSNVGSADNVVVQTYWKKTGVDGKYTGTFIGATPFTANTLPTGTTFVPFDKLTEADVLGWIQSVVVDQYEKHVNERIQDQIDASKNSVVDSDLPWVKPEPVKPEPVANTTPTANTP